jgi:hypothetical protein
MKNLLSMFCDFHGLQKQRQPKKCWSDQFENNKAVTELEAVRWPKQ